MTAPSAVLLDTSIVIAHLRGDSDLTDRLKRSRLYLALTVVGELYFGAYKSANPAKSLSTLRTFVEICPVLPMSARTAELYGQIKAGLESAGARIPENDVWIAAVAQEHALPLVTRDQHFSAVAGLEKLHW